MKITVKEKKSVQPEIKLQDLELGTVINFGDRICQFRIIKKQPHIEFEEVDNLDNESRGGLGSTGIK